MTVARYPSYTAGGAEWLGDVPSHWRLLRLRFVAEFNPSKSEVASLPKETEVSFVPMEAVGDDGSLDLSRLRAIGDVETGYTYFRNGDVTFAKITPCFENGKGAIMRGLAEGIGFGTTELIVARPRRDRTVSDYLHWLFTSPAFRKLGEAAMYGAGGQKRVPDDFVKNFRIAFPPLPEQRAIAAFLDRETGKIDALVEEQRRLIELLKEKRQAVISHAVTRGLDPNAKMKDSGVEWLGAVPESWNVGALKHFVIPRAGAIKTGPFGSQLTSTEMEAGEIKVYNQRNVIDDDFDGGENFITEKKFAALSSFETFPGDLLVTTRGTIGRAAILPESAAKGILHPCLLRVQPDRSKLDTKFLAILIQDSDLIRTQIDLMSNATTIEVIYSGTMASLIVPLPPVADQVRIVEFLSEMNQSTARLKSEAEAAIALLQERRSALIAAAVTGKIDVRGLAPAESEAA